MNIKEASNIINAQIKKIKEEVLQWEKTEEYIFSELNIVIHNDLRKSLKNLKIGLDENETIQIMEDYEKIFDAKTSFFIDKIVDLNKKESEIIKNLSKDLGDVESIYLDKIKKKTDVSVKKNVLSFIDFKSENYFVSSVTIQNIDKKINELEQSLIINENDKEINYLEKMAKMEFFCTEILNISNKEKDKLSIEKRWEVENPVLFSIFSTHKEERLLLELESVLDVISLNNSKVKDLVKSYKSNGEEQSLSRFKQAMDGVIKCFKYLKKDLEYNNYILNDMSTLFLNDINNHLNLAKACIVNDEVEMRKAFRMDTASRDLISIKLFNYLNTPDFINRTKQSRKAQL